MLALVLGLLAPCPALAADGGDDGFKELFPKEWEQLNELERKFQSAKNTLLGIKDPNDVDAIADYEAERRRQQEQAQGEAPPAAPSPFQTRAPDANTGLKTPDEIRAALRPGLYAAKDQFVTLGMRTADALRTRYSQQVDECKRTIATGDSNAATTACQRAEATMQFCNDRLYPEFERRATRLTSDYQPYFGEQGTFRNPFTFCESVLRNIDDPARLLREAQFRLPDDSCYAHLAVLTRMARNGEMPKYPQPWQQTPQVYAKWIAERCPQRIADKALALAGMSPTADLAADLNTPSPALAALPRRAGSDSAAVVQGSVTQAAQDAADPAAAAARRAAEAQAREEAVQRLRQSGAESAAQLVSTTVGSYVTMEQQRLQAEAERRAREDALRAEQARIAAELAQQQAAQRQAAQQAYDRQMAQQQAQQQANLEAQRQAQQQQQQQQQLAQQRQQQQQQQQQQLYQQMQAQQAAQQQQALAAQQAYYDAQRRAQEEAMRYYPPLGCERAEVNREGSEVIVNRCTSAVEISWNCGGSGCMSTVSPGGYVYRRGATIAASCEPSHSYDYTRRMCKR